MKQRPNVWQVLTGVVIAIGVIVTAVAGVWATHTINKLQEEGSERNDAITSLSQSLDQANERLLNLGAEPVPTSQPAQDGRNGEEGDSAYEVWLAAGNTGSIRDYLTSLQGSDGKDGVNGQDGQPGKDGAPALNGTNGKDGKDGLSIQGEPGVKGDTGEKGDPGRAPTAEEIAAAVGTYCGQTPSPCVGPQGPQGVPGTNGVDGQPGATGRGVAKIECGEDGRWRFYFTDDPSVPVMIDGPCRVVIPPSS